VGRVVAVSLVPKEYTRLTFTPDGRRFVVQAPGASSVRDRATGSIVHKLPDSLDPYKPIAISPDGARLAAVMHPGQLLIWDLEAGKQERFVPLPRANTEIRGHFWSAGGDRLILGLGNGTVLFVDPNTGKEVLTLQALLPSLQGMAYNPQTNELTLVGGPGQVVMLRGGGKRGKP
jgi:WD40 repeat protein